MGGMLITSKYSFIFALSKASLELISTFVKLCLSPLLLIASIIFKKTEELIFQSVVTFFSFTFLQNLKLKVLVLYLMFSPKSISVEQRIEQKLNTIVSTLHAILIKYSISFSLNSKFLIKTSSVTDLIAFEANSNKTLLFLE